MGNKYYQVWLYPNGEVVQTESAEACILAEVDSIRFAEVDSIRFAELLPAEMGLQNGVVLYDEHSKEPVNMAATKLCNLPARQSLRGRVLFGQKIPDEERVITTFDADTAEWIRLWAECRCTVCGCRDKPLRWEAYPLTAGRCCEQCGKVVRSLRAYMGI